MSMRLLRISTLDRSSAVSVGYKGLMVGRAPASVTITPRNPEREFVIGGKHMVFVNVSSPPNAWDMERGKRSGDFETFKDFIKLTQYFNCIHVAGGYPVEPIDILSLIHISEPTRPY